MVPSSQCEHCKHWADRLKRRKVCSAFPSGIPDEIFWWEFDHRNPYPGDNGIRFEPQNQYAAAFHLQILGHNPRVSQAMLEIERLAREMALADTDSRLLLLWEIEPRLDILRTENAVEIDSVSKPNEQHITELEGRLSILANLPLVIEAEDARSIGPSQQRVCPVCLSILQMRVIDSLSLPPACLECLAPFYEVYSALSKHLRHAQPTQPQNRYSKPSDE